MDFSVVCSGGLREGVSADEARRQLAELFRTADAQAVERLLGGRPVVVKSGLTADVAERYRLALWRAGLECSVQAGAVPAEAVPQGGAPASSAKPASVAPAGTPPSAVTEPASPAVWWLLRGQEKLGPYAREALVNLAASGGVLASDRLWKAGLKAPLAVNGQDWLVLAMALAPAASASALDRGPYLPPSGGEELVAALRSEPWWSIVYIVGAIPMATLVIVLLYRLTPAGTPVASFADAGVGLMAALFALVARRAWRSGWRPHLGAYIAISVVCGLLLSMLSNTGNSFGDGFARDNLLREVASANRQLPKQVDPETRMDRVVLENKTIVFKLSVLHNNAGDFSADEKTAFVKQAHSLLLKRACNNPDTVWLLQHSDGMRYDYVGKDHKLVLTISIKTADCPGAGH